MTKWHNRIRTTVCVVLMFVVGMVSSHNVNMSSCFRYMTSDNVASSIHSIERLLYLDVRKMMLSSTSQSVVRPLYNGGSVVLRGAHHHLLSMLVDALILIIIRVLQTFNHILKDA